MKTLLKNAFVVTMDEEKGVYSRGCVVVEDDRIAGVYNGDAPVDQYDEIIHGKTPYRLIFSKMLSKVKP